MEWVNSGMGRRRNGRDCVKLEAVKVEREAKIKEKRSEKEREGSGIDGHYVKKEEGEDGKGKQRRWSKEGEKKRKEREGSGIDGHYVKEEGEDGKESKEDGGKKEKRSGRRMDIAGTRGRRMDKYYIKKKGVMKEGRASQ